MSMYPELNSNSGLEPVSPPYGSSSSSGSGGDVGSFQQAQAQEQALALPQQESYRLNGERRGGRGENWDFVKFLLKDWFLTVSGAHLFLGVCFRKKSHKRHYTTVRRLVFLCYCLLCSMFFVFFMQQLKYFWKRACSDTVPVYKACVADFGGDSTRCASLVDLQYITPESAKKLIKRNVFVFHYEYPVHNKTASFAKYMDNGWCVRDCVDEKGWNSLESRPLCNGTDATTMTTTVEAIDNNSQKSGDGQKRVKGPEHYDGLYCMDHLHYCRSSGGPLANAILSGFLAVIFFYPSKLLLSCSLKITGPGRLCHNIVGKIWLFLVFCLLALIILFWISIDSGILADNRALFKSVFHELFLYGLWPFTISMATSFTIDFVVGSLFYLLKRKWRKAWAERPPRSVDPEEQNERSSLLAPPPPQQ